MRVAARAAHQLSYVQIDATATITVTNGGSLSLTRLPLEASGTVSTGLSGAGWQPTGS